MTPESGAPVPEMANGMPVEESTDIPFDLGRGAMPSVLFST
jgi:hypothetical protein